MSHTEVTLRFRWLVRFLNGLGTKKAPEQIAFRSLEFYRQSHRLSPVRVESRYTLNELPHPHVLFTFGLLNLNPAPSSVSM